jgi:serine-type D-Ala-D-Ala carboxypeptidase/endopeptidase (penicillin-binding protein 4)
MTKRGSRAIAAALGIVIAVGVLLAGMPSPAAALPPATVTMDLASPWTVPGRCDDATVTVSPDKTGQQVEVQRLSDGAWSAFATGTLGPGSTVTIPLCFGWGALGIVSLRAAWESDGANESATSPPADLPVRRATWMAHISRLASRHSMSISVSDQGISVYRRDDVVARRPASNEKLLLSMALLQRLGSDAQIGTDAAATSVSDGVVRGDLWLLGHGDPGITTYRLNVLARHVAEAGVTQITGRVMGSRAYFAHDWWAPGWKPDFPREEVPLPTALTFNGNTSNGVHITDPERRAATAFAKHLQDHGVRIDGGAAGVGTPPDDLHAVASIISPPLATMLRPMDVYSLNFYAEVLGKRLAVAQYGQPGTIAHGAAAIRQFAASAGVPISSFDSSGLSYSNRVSAYHMVALLKYADTTSWLGDLRAALPGAGQGTLKGRLAGVRVHAKTGTLDGISALSGWVWVEQEGRWAEFSILSSGDTTSLKNLEDRIVTVVAEHSP